MAKVTLKEGCPGCGQRWRDQGAEGQCSRCKRCLECCGHESVPFTCAAKDAGYRARHNGFDSPRSQLAYERWLSNHRILGHNRRIV